MSTGAVVLICLLVLLGASVLRWDAVKARLMSWFDPPPPQVGPGLVEEIERAPRHLHEAQAHHAPASHKPEIHRSGRRG